MLAIFKALLCTLSLLNDYMIVEEVVDNPNVIYIDQYVKVYKEDAYYLNFDSSIVKIDAEDLKVIVKENIVSVVYYDGEYFIYNQYQLNGELINTTYISREKPDEYAIDYCCGSLYIAGTITNYRDYEANKQLNGSDAIIIKVTKEVKYELYGGTGNEGFTNIAVSDGRIYACGIKDGHNDGDFLGGTSDDVFFVSLFDADLNLLKYNTINYQINNIHSIYVDEYATVITDKFICNIDNDLNVKSKAIDSMWAHANNTFIVTYDGSNFEIYNRLLAYQTEISYQKEIIRTAGKALITKDDTYYIIDIVSNNSLLVLEDYIYNVQPPSMKTLFGEASFESKYSEPYFDALICGDYLFTYSFCTPANIAYEIQKLQEVVLEYNVVEGGIYPINYCLRYTGIARLNGNMIVNNHAITKPGDYTLELSSYTGNVKTIDFTVAEEQFIFTDIIFKKYDKEVQKNKSYQISFKINLKNIEIISIIIDEKEVTDFVYDNSILTITMPPQEKNGIVNHVINKITYVYKNQTYEYIINKPYYVNVLSSVPYVTSYYEEAEKSKIIIETADADNTLRFLLIKVSNGAMDKDYKIPLGNSTIMLEGLEPGSYSGAIFIAYNTGIGVERYYEIGKLDFQAKEDNIIGNVSVVNSSTVIQKIELELVNDFKTEQLTKLSIEKDVVYQGSSNDFRDYIKYGSILAVVSMILIYFLRIVKRRKLNDKYSSGL